MTALVSCPAVPALGGLIGTLAAWPGQPATRAQDLRAFLSWAISTGNAQLAHVNFQPLPLSVLTLSQAQIAKIKG